MPRRPNGPVLTADRVVDGAVELTRARGIDGWTIRDLAAHVGAWPNSIAHHVGDREAVLSAVVNRVVGMMPNPSADLMWQEWFRRLLLDGAAVLAQYRGVARRLCRDGPTVPAALPIIDRGVGLLHAAGFGDDAPRAHSALLNGAMLLIALDDDRAAAGHDHHVVVNDLLAVTPPEGGGVGWESMRAYLEGLTVDREASRTGLYRYTIEILISGLAAELRNGRADDGDVVRRPGE